MHATIDSSGNVTITYNAREGHLAAPHSSMYVPCASGCGKLLIMVLDRTIEDLSRVACVRCICDDGWTDLGDAFQLRWSDGRPTEVRVSAARCYEPPIVSGLGGSKLNAGVETLVRRMGWSITLTCWAAGSALVTSCEPVKP